MAVGILGGAFDPPHVGHVSLAAAAIRALALDELLVLVVADPGHKDVATPADVRLELTRLAFEGVPEAVVEIDVHGRTVDSLQDRELDDPYFVLGADELASFESWKDPRGVLRLARLAVAMRPGVSHEAVDAVRDRLEAEGRIVEFDLEPVDVSSTEIRRRVAAGLPIDELVPQSVASAIARLGLYRGAE